MDKNKIRQIIREAFEVQLNEYGGENYPLYNDSNSPNTKVFWGKKAAGILAYAMDTKKFLVPLRSEHVYQPLTYGVIGGKLDEGENNIKQAAIREFEEETDYSGTIKLIPLYIFKTEGFEYNNFLGIIQKQFNPSVNWETKEFEWLTFDELINLPSKHFGLEALLSHSRSKIEKEISK